MYCSSACLAWAAAWSSSAASAWSVRWANSCTATYAPKTAMAGNLINDSVQAPGQTGQAGAFVMLVLVVTVLPMLYYVRVTLRGDEVKI